MNFKHLPERRGLILDLDDWHDGWLPLLHEAGINVLGLHNWDGDNAFHEKIERMIRFFETPAGGRLRNTLDEAGIELEFELHAMSWLLPRHHYDEHPEWFRMNEAGERTPKDNFCPSNVEALAEAATRAVLLARLLRPTSGRYYLWQDDNKSWCRCKACRVYSDSEQTLLVMNALLEALRQEAPDTKLAYLAYAETLENPPAKVAPSPGVFLEIAGPAIHQMKEEHPLPISTSEKYQRAVARNVELFGVKDAQVLEYWLDVSFHSRWRKPVRPIVWEADSVKRDIAFYRGLGFRSITSFAVFMDEAYFAAHGTPPVADYGRLLAEQT